MTRTLKNPAVLAALQRLADRNDGVLLPEQVVDAARDKESPLHSHFDWSNTVAAGKWRLHQARNLIQVVVQTLPGRENEPPTKVFVSLSGDREEGGYRRMITVLSDTEQREELLRDAHQDMEVFRKKYKHLKELAAVIAAMNEVRVR